jgi:hypothetical protein
MTARALIAAVGDRSSFKNGRQFAAWLGLVPKQRSSGGRARLFGISKRGDRYLRTLLIHGAPDVPKVEQPPVVETKEPTRQNVQWCDETWEHVLPPPFDDARTMSPSRHARHVMDVWRCHGRKVVRDMPQWAIDIISEHEPSSADRIRALLAKRLTDLPMLWSKQWRAVGLREPIQAELG